MLFRFCKHITVFLSALFYFIKRERATAELADFGHIKVMFKDNRAVSYPIGKNQYPAFNITTASEFAH